MVVRSSLVTADARPWADVAVVHRLWVIRRRKDLIIRTGRLLEQLADQAKVGRVVVDAILVNGRGSADEKNGAGDANASGRIRVKAGSAE